MSNEGARTRCATCDGARSSSSSSSTLSQSTAAATATATATAATTTAATATTAAATATVTASATATATARDNKVQHEHKVHSALGLRVQVGDISFELPFAPLTRIRELKKWVEHHYEIPVERQQWRWKWQVLRDELTVRDYNMHAHDAIHPIICDIAPKVKATMTSTSGDGSREQVIDPSTGVMYARTATTRTLSTAAVITDRKCNRWNFSAAKFCRQPAAILCQDCISANVERAIAIAYCSTCDRELHSTHTSKDQHKRQPIPRQLGLPQRLDPSSVHRAAALF